MNFIENVNFSTRLQKFGRYINQPYINFLKRSGLAREFTKAQGIYLYDSEGNCFIDCISGYGNCNIGHNHPKIIEAVTREIMSMRPFNHPFISDVQTMLAEKLAEITPGNLECSLFVNSGSEAVESALKLARLYTGKYGVVAASGAWHGFTYGALSVSESSLCQQFTPMLPEIKHVPYNDVGALSQALTGNIGAVIIEPIQAESGAIVPDSGYLQKIAQICDERKVVLIFDEVKTGVGKTGTFFCCEKENAVPDILLSGKSLGGGVMPIGVMTARKKIWGKLGYSFPMSSTSAGGNAPACAAALATLEIVEMEDLCENARSMGEIFLKELDHLVRMYPSVLSGFSGQGLLVALHTKNWKSASIIINECIKRKILLMSAFCDRSKILIEPPLCIKKDDVLQVIESLNDTLRQMAV